MSKFSKGKKKKDPAISTAALPDIVFMLLFFHGNYCFQRKRV